MRNVTAAIVVAATLAVGTFTATPAEAGGLFSDTGDNIHEGDIEKLAELGITRGCNPPANTRYCPDDPVTRGQMAAFLVRALELGGEKTAAFADTGGHVFASDISALAGAGITKGCNPPANTRYCPDDPVTRGQMAAFLVRAFGYTDDSGGDLFGDDDGSVFEGDIDRLAVAGVTRGCNPPANDRFCPGDPVTRGQMASFLIRSLGTDTGTGNSGSGSGDGGGGTTPPPPPPGVGEFTIHFLDVRQGDAALYVGACGEIGLVDANRYRENEILAALDRIGSRNLKWIVVSHYDADHLGAIQDVGTAPGVTVGTVYDRGGDRNTHNSATYRNYYDWVNGAGLRQPVSAGDTLTLCAGADQVRFTVKSPNADWTVGAGRLAVNEENDRSVCLHIEYYDFDVASCGDINGVDSGSRHNVEAVLAADIGEVDVVKVNHHGSTYSSNLTWVNTLDADVAVISVGKNSYGHPDPGVVARWTESGAVVYQTGSATISGGHVDGDITITTTGNGSFTAEASHSGKRSTHQVKN